MATAAELLSATLDEVLVIDSSLRTIKIPPSITNLGVESDDETTILKFQMPRYNDGIDLKDFVVRINYENAGGEGDVYEVTDKVIDDDYITFSWLVGRFAVKYRGNVKFIVCLKKFQQSIVDKEFNTTIATLPVLEGLETEEVVVEDYPDAIAAAAYEAILLALDSDLKGEPGHTPVKGTDYYTTEERDAFAEEVISAAQGVYANAYKKNATGTAIRVDDVSPLEHTVGVKVQSKNMCPMSVFDVMHPNGSITEYDPATHTITMLTDTPGSQGQYISPVKKLIVGESYTMSFDIKGTPGKKVKCGWDKKNIVVELTDEYVRHSATVVATHAAEAIIFYNKATVDGGLSAGEYMQFDNVQVELGDTATEYSEYIDPSTVTLTRCGKNLIPLTTFTHTPSSSTTTVTNGVLTLNGYLAAHRIPAAGLAGKTLTMSCVSSRTGEKGGGLSIEFRDVDNDRISGIYKQNELSPSFSFNVPLDTVNIVVFFYASGSAAETGTATYKNIQLELGDDVTEHALYTGGDTYTPKANGVVENVYSLSPYMSMYTDTPGVTIEAEYSRDTNALFEDVATAVEEIIEIQEGFIDGSINVGGTVGGSGTSVTITKITESAEDGGNNVIKFSDGSTLTIKNGNRGSKGLTGNAGHTPEKGVDYWTDDDKEEILDECDTHIIDQLAERAQFKPEFANDINECVDATKVYVLPDGNIYAYVKTIDYPEIEIIEGGIGYYYYNSTTEKLHSESTAMHKRTNYIPVTEGDTFKYVGQKTISGSDIRVSWYDENKNWIGYEPPTETKDAIITVPQAVKYARFYSYRYTTDISLVELSVTWITCANAISERWTNTGHAFVPADYEEEILELKDKVRVLETSNRSILKDKKIVYDGDSLCAPYGTKNGGAYPQLIANVTGCIFDNRAEGGGRIRTLADAPPNDDGSPANFHSIVDNLGNLPEDGDLYCFEGGVNDHWGRTTLGDFSPTDYTSSLDITTFCGALETVFRYSLAKFVGKPICFVIANKCVGQGELEGFPYTFANFREKIIGICEKYSIPYYDAWAESGLNFWCKEHLDNYFVYPDGDTTGDGTHPNAEGYKRYYVPQLISLFEKIIPR